MNWWFAFYAVAGVLLTLFIFHEEEDCVTINAVLVSVLFGWAIGVPVFVILLVCFGNWPVILRSIWRLVCLPSTAFRAWKSGRSEVERG